MFRIKKLFFKASNYIILGSLIGGIICAFLISSTLALFNLTFVSLLILLWLLLNTEIKRKRWQSYLTIVLIMLTTASIITFYAGISSWQLLLANFCINILIASSFYTGLESKKTIYSNRLWAIIQIGLVVLLPIVFFLSYRFIDSTINDLAKSDFNNITIQIKDLNYKNLEQSRKIAGDQFLQDFLLNKKYQDLQAYLQNLMVSNRLSYLMITDESGTVLSRAHQPKALGDNIFTEIPATKSAMDATGYLGINKEYKLPPYLAAGSAIEVDGKKIGAIFAGELLNDQFAQNLSIPSNIFLAFSDKGQVYGRSTPSKDFDSFLQSGSYTKQGNFGINKTRFSYASGYFPDDPLHLALTSVIVKNPAPLISAKISCGTVFGLDLLLLIILILLSLPKFKKKNGFNQKIAGLFKKDSAKRILFGKNIDWTKIASSHYLLPAILLIPVFILLPGNFRYFQTQAGNNLPAGQNEIEKEKPELFLDVQKNFWKKGDSIPLNIFTESKGALTTLTEISLDFDRSILEVSSIDTGKTACDKILSQKIENSTGNIEFSCEFNPDKINLTAPQLVGTIYFKPLRAGIATFGLSPTYSYLMTPYGKDTQIVKNLEDSERVIITD